MLACSIQLTLGNDELRAKEWPMSDARCRACPNPLAAGDGLDSRLSLYNPALASTSMLQAVKPTRTHTHTTCTYTHMSK
eukprot:1158967-Pelagomonas_calceolata.AAC.4